YGWGGYGWGGYGWGYGYGWGWGGGWGYGGWGSYGAAPAGRRDYTVSASHLYLHAGSYPADTTLYDDADVSAQDSRTVGVADGALRVIEARPLLPAAAGEALSDVLLATVADTEWSLPASSLSALVDWGDGSTTAGVLQANADGTFGVLGSHVYARLGTYAFTAVVRNTAGTVSTAARGTASVTDLDVSLTARSIPAIAGEAFVDRPVAWATGLDADPKDVTVTIDWGDRQTSAGTLSGLSLVLGSHTYG